MTKLELKDLIYKLELDAQIESLLMELIDEAKEVNNTLLAVVSDVLDQQASFYESAADILDKEVEVYENLEEELKLVGLEESKDKLEVIKTNKENLLKEINAKVEEMRMQAGANSASKDTSEIDQIKKTLQQAATTA